MAEPLPLPDPADEPPAGPNLELDPAFGEMERAAQGKPEGQFGDTIEAATPPDWKEAATLALALLERTRDLRVMVLLAIARINLGDLAGFAEVLATIRQHIETMWDRLHPQLDPEDDNDPMHRGNALLPLTEVRRVLRPMRNVTLAAAPRMRPVAWVDIAVLKNAMEPEPGRDRVNEAAVRGAFAATEPARLAATRESLESVVADLKAIPVAFDGHAGVGQAPDLTPLAKLARDMLAEMVRYEDLARDAAPEAEADQDATEGEEPDGEAAERPARGARSGRSFNSIRSIGALDNRDDALHALTLAAAYFRLNEPSSPLPLLIDRAARLAPLPFMDILRDLAPDGLQQAQMIAGPMAEEG